MAHSVIKSLDISVLLRLARLDVQQLICFAAAHAFNLWLTYSGPLAHLNALSLPRHSIIRFKAQVARFAGKDRSTSTPKPSRLKSSITLKTL